MALTTSANQILQHQAWDAAMSNLPAEYWDLVNRYRGSLVNQAFVILKSVDDAEDVVQETFCEIFRDQEKLAKVHSLGAWLRRINKTNAMNKLRNRDRYNKHKDQKQGSGPAMISITGGFGLYQSREVIAKAIERLPEELREIVVLHYWQHFEYEEIAKYLKVTPRTVRRNLHEAYEVLYTYLKDQIEHTSKKGNTP